MKGGVAAFCCAVSQFVRQKFDGSIKIFLTGDEEVGSFEGIQSLIKWSEERNELPDDCLIGEPSSHIQLGDRVYVGHRGSMNVMAKCRGKQGHIAYQGNFENSLRNLSEFIVEMMRYDWKHDVKDFPRTNLEPTMLFTNNYATNVAPDTSSANLNIRFGADYTSEELKQILQTEAAKFKNIDLEFNCCGEAYICRDQKLQTTLSRSIKNITGIDTHFSCAGGTSDGRYMIKHCNVIEFGVIDSVLHQKNEKTKIDDLMNLEKIYLDFMKSYFAQV
jgi:succinyl-diaminopimelate desuccinylase